MISRCSALIDSFVVDEPLRQVVEQLGMRRPLAGDAEVARRVDQAGAEMPLPDPVDDDAHRDRLRRIASASSRRPLPFVNGAGSLSDRTLRKWRGTSAPRLYGLPRRLTFRFDRLLDVADAVDERILRRLRLAQRLDVAAQRLDVAAAIGAQLPLEPPACGTRAARA